MSFENSNCKEYITEKFWFNAFSNFAVPIVMGPNRSDYEKVAPPNSFIHVDDFNSPKDLARYLHELNSDDELYGKYLRWRSLPDNNGLDWRSDVTVNSKLNDPTYKQMIEEVIKTPDPMCRLCEKLKNESPLNKSEVIGDLEQWFYGEGYISPSRSFPVCSGPDSGHAATEFLPVTTIFYSLVYFLFSGIIFYCLFGRNRVGYKSHEL